MNNELNKTFEYKSYNFNITVYLNDRVERSLDGKREHKIRINCMNFSNFYETFYCETSNLKDTIEKAKQAARNDVDTKLRQNKSKEEIILMELGFK